MSDKKKTFIKAEVPDKMKEEYVEMCTARNFQQAEFIKKLVREELQKWKQDKAA